MSKRPIQRCPKGALTIESESNNGKGRGCWFARVPSAHTIEDVLRPEYFGSEIGPKGVRAGDCIDIEPEGAVWAIRVRVMAVLPHLQEVRVREYEKLRENFEVKAPPGFRFDWDGTSGKWQILKGEVRVDGGFDTQDECLARVQELMRQKAA
jgi:hypothetical protein